MSHFFFIVFEELEKTEKNFGVQNAFLKEKLKVVTFHFTGNYWKLLEIVGEFPLKVLSLQHETVQFPIQVAQAQ